MFFNDYNFFNGLYCEILFLFIQDTVKVIQLYTLIIHFKWNFCTAVKYESIASVSKAVQ